MLGGGSSIFGGGSSSGGGGGGFLSGLGSSETAAREAIRLSFLWLCRALVAVKFFGGG